jgi:hypothetical protein
MYAPASSARMRLLIDLFRFFVTPDYAYRAAGAILEILRHWRDSWTPNAGSANNSPNPSSFLSFFGSRGDFFPLWYPTYWSENREFQSTSASSSGTTCTKTNYKLGRGALGVIWLGWRAPLHQAACCPGKPSISMSSALQRPHLVIVKC